MKVNWKRVWFISIPFIVTNLIVWIWLIFFSPLIENKTETDQIGRLLIENNKLRKENTDLTQELNFLIGENNGLRTNVRVITYTVPIEEEPQPCYPIKTTADFLWTLPSNK